jgi:myo-inositol-hexaphosphate 3-phosphohydrolase
MKIYFTFFLVIMAISNALAQYNPNPEKTAVITDSRSKGLYVYSPGGSVEGYKDGDVSVERIKDLDFRDDSPFKGDTINGYLVHFYKPWNGTLKNYHMACMNREDFDRVTYYSLSNTEVLIVLFNSITNKKYSLKLTQHGDEIGASNMSN